MTREEAERRVLNAVAHRLTFWKRRQDGPLNEDDYKASEAAADALIHAALDLDKLISEKAAPCPE